MFPDSCKDFTLFGKVAYFDDGRYERVLTAWSKHQAHLTDPNYELIEVSTSDGPRMLRNLTLEFSDLVYTSLSEYGELFLTVSMALARFVPGQHPELIETLVNKCVVVPPRSSAQVFVAPQNLTLYYPGSVKIDPGISLMIGWVRQAAIPDVTIYGSGDSAFNLEYYFRNC